MSQDYPGQPPSSEPLRPQMPPSQPFAPFPNPAYPAPQQMMPQEQQPFAQPLGQPPFAQPLGQPPFAQPPYMAQPLGQPSYIAQSQGYPYPAPQTNVVVNIQQPQGPGFLVRALYFIFIGWWAGLFWLNVGYFLCLTVILLPFGLIMLNRLPQVITLRPSGQQTSVSVSTSAGTTTVNVSVGGTQQYSMLIRAIYFIFVGWWAGFLWAYLAYFLCISIFLLPVGLIMFNNLPLVLTLRRN